MLSAQHSTTMFAMTLDAPAPSTPVLLSRRHQRIAIGLLSLAVYVGVVGLLLHTVHANQGACSIPSTSVPASPHGR